MIISAIRTFSWASFLRWSLAIIATFVIIGCKKNAENIEAVFVVTENNLQIMNFEEKVTSIGVYPGGKHNWEIENKHSWLTISPQSGKINKSLTNLTFTVDREAYIQQYPDIFSKTFIMDIKSETVKNKVISLEINRPAQPLLNYELLTPFMVFDELKTIDTLRIYNPNPGHWHSLAITASVPWVKTEAYISPYPETTAHVPVEVVPSMLGSGTHHASLIMYNGFINSVQYRVDITLTIE
jgi:hypothetical protein